MNFLDIAVIIVFVWGAYKGFTKGFLVSFASLLALFAGIFGATKFSSITAGILVRNNILTEKYADLIAFSLTFLLIIVVIHIIARILTRIIEAVELGLLNRIAGVFFNLLKSAFIISVVLVLFNYINNSVQIVNPQKLDNSIFYKPLSKFAPSVFPYLKFKKKSMEPAGISDEDVFT